MIFERNKVKYDIYIYITKIFFAINKLNHLFSNSIYDKHRCKILKISYF